MRLGVCCTLKDAAAVKELGFDYFECGFRSVAEMTDDEFAAFAQGVADIDFYPLAMNVMLPGTARVTGDGADHEAIRPIIEKGFARAGQVRTKSVVFGSAGARNLPEGFTDRAKGYDQIVEYLKMAGDIAGKNGVTIAIEPLSFKEANIVNFVAEAAYLAQRVNHPHVRALADYFHMVYNREPVSTLYAHGSFLQHCHIASPEVRAYPSPDDGHDYGPFFKALVGTGYQGCVSIEGRLQGTMQETGKVALELMRACLK